jgi:osmotically-inducible protein OsmY
MDSKSLQEAVQNQLRYEPRVDSSKIGVTADDSGVVVLSGSVPSFIEKLEAEAAAKRVYGVRGVASEIEVKLASGATHTDAEIAQAAVNGLRWSTGIPDERIKVIVSAGRVTLEGDVEQNFQRQEAERVVRALPGVLSVTNHIRIKPTVMPQPERVKKEIEEALVRSARLDARGIVVRIEGSRVILDGSVRAWAEADEAADAAWAAPGVTEVESHLSIL